MAKIFRTHEALRAKFPSPEYALFFEVRDKTGYAARRSADALAMSLWPSRGLHLIGFEFKASRGDWLREQKNPEKAESIFQHCDRWYLVVADKEIVKPGELPPTWGLLVPHTRGTLKTEVEAPLLPRQETVDRKFMAAILRRANEEVERAKKGQLSDEEKVAIVDAETRAKIGQMTAELERRANLAESDCKSLRAMIERFEQASGIALDSWSAGRVGAIVRALLPLDRHGLRHRLESLAQNADDIIRNAKNALAALEEDK